MDNENIDTSMQAKPVVKLYRRISDTKKNITNFLANLSQTNLPFHINTALSQHLSNSQSSGYLDRLSLRQLNTIRHNRVASQSDLKASMWSLAFLCASEKGFEYISSLNQTHRVFTNLFDFICYFVDIAETHPRLTMRATCYYCLNLVSKSSTGANLIGKLGWHTFKTNRLKANENFLLLSSLANLDEDNYSTSSEFYGYDLSFDFFGAFYNLLRGKASTHMKQLKKYGSVTSMSKFELSFLNEANLINLLEMSDTVFLKQKTRGIYLESLCVPMRASLVSIEDEQVYSGGELYETDDWKMLNNGCGIQKCFYCYLLAKNWIQLDDTTNFCLPNSLENRARILSAIRQLILAVHPEVERLRLKIVNDLRRLHASEFNFCLMILVYERYLSGFKLKFQWRTFLQEMFLNVLPLQSRVSFS